ncbi:pseudouridine synthase [Desulfoluna spongiiphila]|uniref:Pseudouridine synthase n=1 Tax=Desulfoluna spongiiphila TaxID=419481 RepID=A0A1G5ACE2_9BACT|nr:pseudouridine synthase [Desulfoluna spongiiphila]SCX75565.1 16S rRNA pseudouridine516 synthase [Desulfoluna spongiiphila]
MTMRLDKLLAHCGYGTRKDVKALLKRKQVTVHGEIETSAKRQVEPDHVRVNGEKVDLPPTDVHLMLNKPAGYACSHNPSESPLVYDLVPDIWQQADPKSAGRLDRYTSGLLILSTDGQLLHQLVHPNKKVGKRYRVVYEGDLSENAVKRVAKGLPLPDDDRPCLPAILEIHGPDPQGRGRATMLIHEGRFHQVRRMFEALGAKVVELHRDRIGNLELPADLPEGHCRELTEDEIDAMTEDA